MATFSALAQEDAERRPNGYVIGLIPSARPNIYGLAIGPIGSESVCNVPYQRRSHGLNVQLIGNGIFQIFMAGKMPIEDMTDTVSNNGAVHNGLIVSTFGTRTDLTRGLSISGWMSMGSRLNGITVCPLWNLHGRINGVAIGAVNHSASLHGVQIGIINKSLRTRGIQFGLWNRNERRALPLVNWNFTHPPRPSYLDNTIRTSIWDTHHPPMRQRVSDRSGKPASDRRECGLEADSATPLLLSGGTPSFTLASSNAM